MRFSIIAIIFQSAIFFEITYAAFKANHIDERLKVFDCDRRIISEPEYRDQQYSASISIRNNQYPYEAPRDFKSDYLENFSDRRWVMFMDDSSNRFYLSELNIQGKYENINNGTLQTSYVLVLDNLGRAVAIFMKLTTTQTSMGGESLIGTRYEICGIVR